MTTQSIGAWTAFSPDRASRYLATTTTRQSVNFAGLVADYADSASISREARCLFDGRNSPSLMDLPPLLIPNRENIETFARQISDAFPGFLSRYDIPTAPETITFDNYGKLQVPADYPYATELKQALAENPTLVEELRTVHALSSHFAGMQEGAAFRQEHARTSTAAEAAAVVAKYSYLFDDDRQPSIIAIRFSSSGGLHITADGEDLF